MFLYGQGLFKRDLAIGPGTEPRQSGGRRPGKGNDIAVPLGVFTATACTIAVEAMIAAAPFTFGLSLLGIPAEVVACAAAGIAVAAAGYAVGGTSPSQPPPVRLE